MQADDIPIKRHGRFTDKPVDMCRAVKAIVAHMFLKVRLRAYSYPFLHHQYSILGYVARSNDAAAPSLPYLSVNILQCCQEKLLTTSIIGIYVHHIYRTLAASLWR